MTAAPCLSCSHSARAGGPCQDALVTGAPLPPCAVREAPAAGAARSGPSFHRFYWKALPEEDAADLVACAGEDTNDDEIAVVRFGLRRALEAIVAGDVSSDQLVHLLELAYEGARTVSRLLRERKSLAGEVPDGFAEAMAVAIEHLGTTMGVDLGHL